MDPLSLTKEARIYNGEKTIPLTSGARNTGQPLVHVVFATLGDGPSERSKCETPFSFLASFLRPLPSQCDSTNFIMLTLNGINPCPIGLLLFGPHTHGRDL